jgi:predicted DsbA family dithiol-disulfide isomerase
MWWLVLKHDGEPAAKKLHDLLYTHQPSEHGPFPSRDDLYALAGRAGADTEALKVDMDSSEDAQDVVEATKQARSLGVSATPTVVLDGRRFTTGGTPGDLADDLIKAVQ